MKIDFAKGLRVTIGGKLNSLDLCYLDETCVLLASIQTVLVDFKDRIFGHNIETADVHHVDPQVD